MQPPAHGSTYAFHTLACATGLAIGPAAAGLGYGALGFRGLLSACAAEFRIIAGTAFGTTA